MCLKVFFHTGAGRIVLCAGFESGMLGIWDVLSGAALGSLRIHQEPLLCMDVCTQRGLLVTGSAERKIGAVDISDLTKVRGI